VKKNIGWVYNTKDLLPGESEMLTLQATAVFTQNTAEVPNPFA